MRRLEVLTNGRSAGVLSEEAPGKGYRFDYCDAYLEMDAPSISVRLPRSERSFRSDTLFPFFANMLPEGANRKMICRRLKIDEDDDFGLLYNMAGADFIGCIGFRQIRDEQI